MRTMSWTNYHNHSQYDDGKDTIENHVLGATEQGVKCLGFSGHCPVSFENNWCMKHEDLDAYFGDIEKAKTKFADQIELYKSMEVDFIPGILSPSDQWIKDLDLDYIIGSVHFVGKYENGMPGEADSTHKKFLHALEHIYQNDIPAMVQDYYHLTRRMIEETKPDIIGHMDKIKMHNHNLWNENARWYRDEVLATLEVIRSAGTIVEVNTRGIYKKLTSETYPGPRILKQIYQMGIPVHINSDGHVPRETTLGFSSAVELLSEIGFRELKVFSDHQWQMVKFNKTGIQW